MPAEMIETVQPGYVLHSEHCYIDLKDLNQSVARARMVAAHNEQAEEAAKLLEHALALWRGPALDGLSGAHIDDVSGQLAEFRLDVCEIHLRASDICSSGEYPVLSVGETGSACVSDKKEPPTGFARYPEGKVPQQVDDKWDVYWGTHTLDKDGNIIDAPDAG
ncbi:hypothetical protein SVIOM74S_00582 [Streptomyces violarus]